jgi:hypothetical protein
MASHRFTRIALFLALVVLIVPSLYAQQTGGLRGRVTMADGTALPGVTVEARSNVLPQPRVTTTDAGGEYRLPALAPGRYTLTFSLAGMQDATRTADVLLRQDLPIDVKMGVAAISENITVVGSTPLVNRESTAIQTGYTSKQLETLPIQQDYRDIQKLIPGVMYTQDLVRGPSAGGSGQDNTYMFDGVNITMPLFGVLNQNPNVHDIEQVTIIRGASKATDFNRAGGFMIDTVSKSGTNQFKGALSYQALNENFIADQVGVQAARYQQSQSWTTFNIGGPILRDQLFFYGSYYRPYSSKGNQSNLYGELPKYEQKRSEMFGKLTWTPLPSLLINGSYRNSKNSENAFSFASTQAPTTGAGSNSNLKLGVLETSWVINNRSFAEVKFIDYRNPGTGRSDIQASVVPAFTAGTHLDINALGTLGRLIVPTPIGNNAAQSAFVAPYVAKYGYICPPNFAALGLNCTVGQPAGGGTVGFGQFANDDDAFYRRGGQAAYNLSLGTRVTHDLHIGYQQNKDSEDRFQTSNGWGLLQIPAGVGATGTCPASACGTAKPAYFIADVSQQGARGVPAIHSEVNSQNFEINDTIRLSDWSFNVGTLVSQDTLYGQGLAKADNYAGLIASPGTKYLMHRFKWSEMVQPRLGATWAYNGQDNVYVSYARYMPLANSDARAASWDRNLQQQVRVYFDQNGDFQGIAPNASSSGKWWQEGIKHPEVNELTIGTGQQITNRWSARAYGRYRKAKNFLEDTNNTARIDFNAPAGIPHVAYVPDLCNTAQATCGPNTIRGAIGSGSTYVIANLDGAFTKYLEATMETEWQGDRLSVGGSYTLSHYYGNFDQDNSSFNTANDTSVFIGSSNIGDAAGRQLWDFKYGDLRGDRRNVAKVHSTWLFPWHATIGAFALYQSGQPYQLESALAYRNLTTSTSDTNRYAEPAGRRKSPSHQQLDMKYSQDIAIYHGLTLQLVADVFNVFNKQTPYDYETRIGTLTFTNDKNKAQVEVPTSISDAVLKAQVDPNNANFKRSDWGVVAPTAKSFFAPRRYQLTARIIF